MFECIQKNLFAFFPKDEFSCNSYLLAGKKPCLIDSGTKEAAEHLSLGLKELGLSVSDIKLILHTHGHADHFAADFLFKKAEIWMHKADAEQVNRQSMAFTASSFFPETAFPKIKNFFSEGQLFDLSPFKLRVVFTPGHTAGSVCFFEEKLGLLFSGDTLFSEGFGRTDLPGGNEKELQASLKKLSRLKYDLLLPGHGSIAEH